ncbi:MAG: zinc dependent phospholipase C family protein [Bacteroidia bacterium]
MKKIILAICTLFVFINGFSWGFFGHRLINRMAVFTLPEKLFAFYKVNIDYVTEHAPDPDRRRYLVKEEGCRHFIDLDIYESVLPIDTIPKNWKDAVEKYSEDTLNKYGIVPWYINLMKFKLTEAFKEKDIDKILKLSADIGHYIADANVPLHATQNYNGQLSGQNGIHAFWESRVPELFSDNYDYFVGRAEYVNDVQKAAWLAVEGSFNAKDSVLFFEKKLNESFPSDKKYVLEQKGSKQVKIYSKEYSAEYEKMLHGQVERRIRASIILVGSIWYTAWVDAGQPDLADLKSIPKKIPDDERKKMIEEEKKLLEKAMIGREE